MYNYQRTNQQQQELQTIMSQLSEFWLNGFFSTIKQYLQLN